MPAVLTFCACPGLKHFCLPWTDKRSCRANSMVPSSCKRQHVLDTMLCLLQISGPHLGLALLVLLLGLVSCASNAADGGLMPAPEESLGLLQGASRACMVLMMQLILGNIPV